jgi:hypothetical protein
MTRSAKGSMRGEKLNRMGRNDYGFTAAEKTALWDRWQRGESLKAIRRAFSKPSSSIYFQLAPHGGNSSCATLIRKDVFPYQCSGMIFF